MTRPVRRRARRALALACVLAAAAALAHCRSGDTSRDDAATGARPAAELNERFLSEDLDVERYVGIFESESREIYAHRHAIAEALPLAPGADVVDVGAGTGLFVPIFAEAVAPGGTVYAEEISPRFLDHLRERAGAEGWENVQVVRGTERSVELPPASVDLAFLCDVYHHFGHPEAMLASLHRALRPGGSLVVIDFERIPGESEEWILEHVRAGRETFRREIEAAGFELAEDLAVDGLKENYALHFRRTNGTDGTDGTDRTEAASSPRDGEEAP